jgi:hypothetical protein
VNIQATAAGLAKYVQKNTRLKMTERKSGGLSWPKLGVTFSLARNCCLLETKALPFRRFL